MTASAERYFPRRAEREVLDYVLEDFPFPLALTYARLQDEFDGQDPVAAAWQLRDAYECLLKFSACLAVADCLNSRPAPEVAQKLIGRLLKPTGLSVGDWHSLLVDALKPLEQFVVDGALSGSARVLPELLGVFFDGKRSRLRPNQLNREIFGGPDSFISWRNARFGYGIFQRDRTIYAVEALRWLGALHRFYEALRPVLHSRQLVSVTPGGEELVWQGTEHPPPRPHEDEPLGEPLPMFLAPRPGTDGESLPLSPLLSVQLCVACGQETAFFFDRCRYQPAERYHRTFCLEYFGGHLRDLPNWHRVGELAGLLSEKLHWERESYNKDKFTELQGVVFRDFEEEYLRPDYLFDAFWRVLDEEQRGYIHLIGEGGTGKTYFVRGLEAEGAERGIPVLAYHSLPGARTDYRTFISELADRARERLNFRTQERRSSVASSIEPHQQFAGFLAELIRANGLDQLVVAIDAIDELPDPERNSATITDLLPPPEELPQGCFVLLTSRRRLRPKIEEDLERIRGDGSLYTPILLSPEDPDNRRVVATYLERHLPEVYRSTEHVAAVLERSGGIFLYARHLARTLQTREFTDPSTLPEAHEFSPAYLERLRGQVGERLYGTVYLPVLLLLSAAQEPVTLEQLHYWGVPPEDLRLALYDLADFLREHRGRSWHERFSDVGENRYELAHEAFLRYVRENPELCVRYRAEHARIARVALAAHDGRWPDADPTEESDLYDLRHTLTHLREAGDTQAEEALLADEGYASACFSAGDLAHEQACYRIAVDLYDQAIQVYRHLVEVKGRKELANKLAGTLYNRGIALIHQGKLDEAVRDCSEAVEIYRHLVEVQGREELAEGLAGALNNRGNALSNQGKLDEAVRDLDEAIHWREFCIQAGMRHLTRQLLRAIRYRMMVLLDLKRWDEAAADVKRFLNHALPFLREDAVRDVVREGVVYERSALVAVLCELAPQDREQVYEHLDEWTEVVRSWVEGQ
jgi:tetratricopeptide (TPR) repeat protein